MSKRGTRHGLQRNPVSADPSNGAVVADAAQHYYWVTELAREVLVELSPQTHVLYVSPNVKRVFGFDPEELRGASAFAHVHPEDLGRVKTEHARRAGQVTCRHRHKDGSWRWVEAVRRDMTTWRGENRQVVVVRDVTEQKSAEEERDRLQAELVQMERLASLGMLAGGIAHDFNNLLTSITAYAGLARMDTREASVADAIEEVLRASDRARELTRQILAFSRHEHHEPRSVQLAPIVRETLSLLKPLIPPNVDLRTELPDDAGIVRADACQVQQIVLNLCSNALHAMRLCPGRLTIRLARDPDAASRGNADPGWVCLSVTDTGHGMDPETRKRIFEPFFTTKSRGEGTGLGLAIVERIARDHGAAIRVHSERGAGTTFQVLFPISAEP